MCCVDFPWDGSIIVLHLQLMGIVWFFLRIPFPKDRFFCMSLPDPFGFPAGIFFHQHIATVHVFFFGEGAGFPGDLW